MSTLQAKYSAEQRAAVIAAHDAGVRPITRIPAMAEAGELRLHGAQLAAFELPYATARQWIRAEQRRRQKRVQTDPDESYVQQRARLSAVVNVGLDQVEKRQKKGETDWELVRQIARAIREVAALPTKDKRATAPGQRNEQGVKESGETTGGLAGAILSAARSNGGEAETAPERPSTQQTQAENADSSAASQERQSESGEQSEAGSLKRAPAQARARLLSHA